MRDRRDPWKWPVVLGLTATLFLGSVLLVPRAWIQWFFSPLPLEAARRDLPSRKWLVVLPPPQVEAVRRVPGERPVGPVGREPVFQDPRWWQDGWRIRVQKQGEGILADAGQDSLEVLLQVLGLERDFLARSRPDSLLASRLLILRREDSFRFEELKPYWNAVTRSRAYADIMSRAADMYGEHLQSRIMVPD